MYKVGTMMFLCDKSRPAWDFEPIYDKKEQAFFTKPEVSGDFSIMVKGAYTSLDIDLSTSTLCCI